MESIKLAFNFVKILNYLLLSLKITEKLELVSSFTKTFSARFSMLENN